MNFNRANKSPTAKRVRGFTLMEMVMVIILLGVLSSGIFGFIISGTKIFVDVTERDQLLSESRFLVERLNRDIRYALPNSVRVESYRSGGTTITHCLEFVPIVWSAFYDDIATDSETAKSSLEAPIMIGSDLTEQVYDRTQADNQWVVVYPTDPDDVYDAINLNGGIRVGLSGVSEDAAGSNPVDSSPGDGMVTVVFDNAMRFDSDSTVSRFYLVDQPISYCVNATTQQVTRHTGYGFIANQTAATGVGTTLGVGVLMGQNVVNELSNNPKNSNNVGDPFRYSDASLERNAIVHLLLRFSRNDEVVVFNNEVHLRNVP